MEKLKIAIVVFIMLVAGITFSVWAEDKKDSDMLAELRRGERVTVTLKSNLVYTGIIKSIINNKIELDVSYDDPVLKGSFSFQARDIKSILARSTFSQIEKDRIAAEKEKNESERVRELPANNLVETKPSAPVETTEKKELSDEELLGLLKKFPQGEKWNGKTHETIKDKNAFLRTTEEDSFLENYQDWLKAIELNDKNGDIYFFKRFLPENGWGEDKYIELINRYANFKIGLNAEEQEFVDKYEICKKVRPIYEEEQKKIQEEKVKEEEAKSLEPQLPPATEEEQPVPENSQEKQPELPSGE